VFAARLPEVFSEMGAGSGVFSGIGLLFAAPPLTVSGALHLKSRALFGDL